EKSDEPFKMPALPLRLAVDRLALGTLKVNIDGEPLPVSISDLATSLSLTDSGGQLVIQSLDVQHDQLKAGFSGEARVLDLRDPWPLQVRLATQAEGMSADSPLCARRYVPSLPQDETQASGRNCLLNIDTALDGNLDALHVVM